MGVNHLLDHTVQENRRNWKDDSVNTLDRITWNLREMGWIRTAKAFATACNLIPWVSNVRPFALRGYVAYAIQRWREDDWTKDDWREFFIRREGRCLF